MRPLACVPFLETLNLCLFTFASGIGPCEETLYPLLAPFLLSYGILCYFDLEISKVWEFCDPPTARGAALDTLGNRLVGRAQGAPKFTTEFH